MFSLVVSLRTVAARTGVPQRGRIISRYIVSGPIVLDARRCLSDSVSPKSALCPTCESPLPKNLPGCPVCFSSSRPTPKTTYYEYLGVKYGINPFDIDTQKLRTRFRELQQTVHPDKWAVGGQGLADIAAESSSFVNKAYRTLLNPYTRAEYILQLQGVQIHESESLNDTELIMEVMEARENLDNAESSEDVDRIRAENEEKIDVLLPKLSSAIQEKDWETAKRETIKLRYLQSIDAAADAWPNRLHDH